jgi:hypothetical protein
LFLNLFIVLTSEQLLPEDDSAGDSRHDGFISQLMLPEIEASMQDVSIFEQFPREFPPETEADVEPVQEEIAVPAVNINKTMTVPSG